jgi:hypothetical protein
LTSITVDPANPAYKHSADGRMLLNKAGDTLIAYPTASGTVTLPNTITAIGNHAFASIALTTLSLPWVTDIGEWAFYRSTALTTLNLPEATTIGSWAFYNCTALTTLSLPKATTIGNYAFDDTGTAALTLTLPQAAPTVEVVTSGGVTYSKTVTISTPASPSGYDSTWEAKFKKTFGSNASISLSYVTY